MREQGDCRSITLALSTIVKASYNFFIHVIFLFLLLKKKLCFFLIFPLIFGQVFLQIIVVDRDGIAFDRT